MFLLANDPALPRSRCKCLLLGTKRKIAAALGAVYCWRAVQLIRCDVRFWHKADIREHSTDVRFSNRPAGVKRFQTIHHCSVDVTRGLVLLYGIGTSALPSW